MSVPAGVRESVVAALEESGLSHDLIRATPVSGGCINHGARIDCVDGARYFLKWNASAPTAMFASEADGLRALRATVEQVQAGVRVPEPLAWGDSTVGSWLLMEHLAPSASRAESDALLGNGLAIIHGQARPVAADIGWPTSNWIGSLPQDNTPCASWADFWRERRIIPQLQRARVGGLLTQKIFDRLVGSIDAALDPTPATGLLHGDLWSGNAFVTDVGVPALIDPAVYCGDGEVDLAMTELFGGFGAAFRAAYEDVRPVSQEYESHRRDLYQLYYLIVHVNLFGDSYVDAARRAAQRVVAAVGQD